MTARLPVFPLGTVLFPGLVLPLHIFEERYRALVRHLVDLPEDAPREFGVVAIRAGWEVAPTGPDGQPLPGRRRHPVRGGLHRRAAAGHRAAPTAGFDIVTVGKRRFRARRRRPDTEPVPDRRVEWLPEPGGPDEVADRSPPG